MSLKGKKIILTGATGGVGREIAKKLYLKGATIVISAKDGNKLSRLSSRLKRLKGLGQIELLAFDLRNVSKIGSFTAEALKLLNDKVDVLINNAGIGYHSKTENIVPQELIEVFNVNSLSPILLTSQLLPHIRQYGKIINVSSVLGSNGGKNMSAYTASKHALAGFSKSLRMETSLKKINVIQIEPGAINTNFTSRTHDKEMKYFLENRKLKRIPPKVIAEIIVNAIEMDKQACLDLIRVTPLEQII